MTNDLRSVARAIGSPPVPSAAVLAAARPPFPSTPERLPVAPDVVILQPYRRTRRRRRMISLTVTLAACLALLVAVAAIRTRQTQVSPSSTSGFPTDAQLASAKYFHITRIDGTPSSGTCHRLDYWIARGQPDGTYAATPDNAPSGACAPAHTVVGRPLFPYLTQSLSWDALAHASTDSTALRAELLAQSQGGSGIVSPVGISLVGPVPHAQRHALVEALLNEPTISVTQGHDSLGRPVEWLYDSLSKKWAGLDVADDWLIADGSGHPNAQGGPSVIDDVFSVINTAAPPAGLVPAPRTAARTQTVTGMVSDLDGRPVAAALVATGPTMDPSNAYLETRPDGSFTLTLPPGAEFFDVTSAGGTYCGQTDIDNAAGLTAKLSFTCPRPAVPPKGTLLGTVTEGGGPAPGTTHGVAATVTFRGPQIFGLSVGAGGRFLVSLRPGTYTITGQTTGGLQLPSKTVVVHAGRTSDYASQLNGL